MFQPRLRLIKRRLGIEPSRIDEVTFLLTQQSLRQSRCSIAASQRCLHTEHKRGVSSSAPTSQASLALPEHLFPAPSESTQGSKLPPALSVLPLSMLLRSYLITAVSSVPTLLQPSLHLMNIIAHSKNPLLSPDHNPVLHFILKKTVYNQFCAGENPEEVRKSVEELKKMGFSGTIVAYGKEAVLTEEEQAESKTFSTSEKREEALELKEVTAWKNDNIATVGVAAPGDFIALKFTGAGAKACAHMSQDLDPSPVLEAAIIEICDRAKARNVRLLFDAEQVAVQKAIDDWTLRFQSRYNKGSEVSSKDAFRLDQGNALVYGTYQAYLRHTPTRLAEHLAAASKDGFTLGVKLVRGAYIGSDPRHYFWATKEETDHAYDSIVQSLLTRSYGPFMKSVVEASAFPEVDLFLASHNKVSVDKACAIRQQQSKNDQPRIFLRYGQLKGMADHISCALIQRAQQGQAHLDALADQPISQQQRDVDIPRAFKYVVWGTVGDCSKYLVRRAQENKDAVSRTVDARKALGKELLRRLSFWQV